MITTVLLEERQSYGLRNDYLIKNDVLHFKINEKYDGWNKIRKDVKAQYICFNFENSIPDVSDEQIEELQSGKTKMILLGIKCRYKWAVQYQNWYYGYDFKTMMSILASDYPAYYKFTNEELLKTNIYYQFAGIFNKKEYDKIWDWMDSILIRCEERIPVRVSTEQNKWKEHLAPFLFTIYVKYWQVRIKCSLSLPYYLETYAMNKVETVIPLPNNKAPRNDIIAALSKLVSSGKVETAVGFSLNELSERKDMSDICEIFRKYELQRQFDALTSIDKEGNIDGLLALKPDMGNSVPVNLGKPQMVIFRWNSIGHDNIIKAFEKFGFECTCISMPEFRYDLGDEFFESLNKFLEAGHYDVAYSTNYIELFAQACYLHNIPYLAWCYDAPTFNKDNNYNAYKTSNIFLFDSDDLRHYKEAGVNNAYYLPLAANLEYYDSLIPTDADKEKYNAEISFVGQLYDSKLTKAMGYLSDYQKAFIGALIDNQTDVYGYNFFPEIIMNETVDWLSNSKFNTVINNELTKNMQIPKFNSKASVNSEALMFLLNRQTTNKARLLLVTLLARHHELKLYADKTSELFKDLKFCGKVDYYTQMPKVFKCSKINLNATLRSIPNGIPLRCIDIMGCGGCLLTNYQRDLDEHFKDDENVLIYRDAGEALEKADFYLTHDTLRNKVAQAGYETVKKYYSYSVKIGEMLEMAGLYDLTKACERNRGI